MIEQQSAGIITFARKNHEQKYLILHYLSGHWDFPKGKLELNETQLEAAIRELQEETGLSATIIPGFQHSLAYTFKERGKLIRKTVTFFVGVTDEQPVRLSREHTGYLWLPFEKAHEKLTYQNAKDLLQLAHEFLLNKDERE